MPSSRWVHTAGILHASPMSNIPFVPRCDLELYVHIILLYIKHCILCLFLSATHTGINPLHPIVQIITFPLNDDNCAYLHGFCVPILFTGTYSPIYYTCNTSFGAATARLATWIQTNTQPISTTPPRFCKVA